MKINLYRLRQLIQSSMTSQCTSLLITPVQSTKHLRRTCQNSLKFFWKKKVLGLLPNSSYEVSIIIIIAERKCWEALLVRDAVYHSLAVFSKLSNMVNSLLPPHPSETSCSLPALISTSGGLTLSISGPGRLIYLQRDPWHSFLLETFPLLHIW